MILTVIKIKKCSAEESLNHLINLFIDDKVVNMIENPEILQKISPYFTEEVLKKIVAKEKNVSPDSVEIVSCNFSERRNKGDSYLSVISRLILVSKVKGELSDTKIFVKSFPECIGARKTLRCSDFFRNEIAFYDEVSI